MEDRDPRAKWTTSINAALWQGTKALPEERAANFITIFGNLRDHRYPPEGTSVVAAYPNPLNCLYMKVVVKVRHLSKPSERSERGLGIRNEKNEWGGNVHVRGGG